jgi:hypothetical protein
MIFFISVAGFVTLTHFENPLAGEFWLATLQSLPPTNSRRQTEIVS